MLQNKNVPEEAYVLLIPQHSFILDALSDFPGTIDVKNTLNEVFTHYFLFGDEGEMAKERRDRIYCLFLAMHDVVDLIALQNFNETVN